MCSLALLGAVGISLHLSSILLSVHKKLEKRKKEEKRGEREHEERTFKIRNDRDAMKGATHTSALSVARSCTELSALQRRDAELAVWERERERKRERERGQRK